MTTTNAQLIAEVARLQAEVARLKSPQDTQLHTEVTRLQAEVSPLAGIQILNGEILRRETIESTGDGSGAGSLEDLQEVFKRSWHGRLGRTHMADVDRLPDTVKKELDDFLRRTITSIVPVDEGYISVLPDMIFSTISNFGLRLEDRGPFAGVVIFNDSNNTGVATITRLQNWAACYYKGGGSYDDYWKASALETLIELARYRGLFDKEGFLKSVD